MSSQQKDFLRFLKLLDDNNVLDYIVISGSWAEFVYANSKLLPDYPLTLRTLDIDFLVKNLRRPTNPISITSLAKENGYTIEQDVMYGTTKIFTLDGMEIEFLVSQKGSGTDPVLKTNLGVNAQALRHMDMLLNNIISVDFTGMTVQVPCPEAYVLHKMVINQERRIDKQNKDANSVISLFPYIDMDKFKVIFNQLTKKERVEVKVFLDKHVDQICESLTLEKRILLAQFFAEYFQTSDLSKKEVFRKDMR